MLLLSQNLLILSAANQSKFLEENSPAAFWATSDYGLH